MEKEIKEITKKEDRWCKIDTPNCSVVVSSPYPEDSILVICKKSGAIG